MNQIAEELGVGYVVEGSVRKSGDRVRITAQLNEVATGSHLWAERYERGLADVFAVPARSPRRSSPPSSRRFMPRKIFAPSASRRTAWTHGIW